MKDNYFLYVGNAYPHKNLETLLRAVENVPEATLVLVGKDDYFYQRLKKSDQVMRLGNRIIFKTKVSDAELKTLYTHAIAFIFPSFMEGFGLPAIEALTNNCPVIVSDIPVFHEILGDTAQYFDPHDVDGLATLLADALRKRPAVDAGSVKKYSWRTMAKETLTIYEACARI